MDLLSKLLWTLNFLTIIYKVKGYADGVLTGSCGSMQVIHEFRGTVFPPQPSPMPFEVRPVVMGTDLITVTLRSKGAPFRGFMLEARNEDGHIVGKFSEGDPQIQLLDCNGLADSAVSHLSTSDKYVVSVNWTSEAKDLDVTFRATIVQTFDIFWGPKNVMPVPKPSTTPGTTNPVVTTLATTLSTTAGTTEKKYNGHGANHQIQYHKTQYCYFIGFYRGRTDHKSYHDQQFYSASCHTKYNKSCSYYTSHYTEDNRRYHRTKYNGHDTNHQIQYHRTQYFYFSGFYRDRTDHKSYRDQQFYSALYHRGFIVNFCWQQHNQKEAY